MKYIISTIKLTDEQLNTSFVDILYYKYNNLPKIGYSGTFDIALPEKTIHLYLHCLKIWMEKIMLSMHLMNIKTEN